MSESHQQLGSSPGDHALSQFLHRWQPLGVALCVVLLLVLVVPVFMAAYGKDGMLGSNMPYAHGANLALRHGSMLSHPGNNDGREGMVGASEPPVFWNAGSMRRITEAQQSAIDSERLDDGAAWEDVVRAVPAAEGMRASQVAYAEGLVNGEKLNPY